MTADEKLAAILAAIQTDPGNRGLAELFTACPGDFAAACHSIAEHPEPIVNIVTGFLIPTADPPAFETDGPLGTVFLTRALYHLGVETLPSSDVGGSRAITSGILVGGMAASAVIKNVPHDDALWDDWVNPAGSRFRMFTHIIAVERVGPAADNRCYTMRGRDVTEGMLPAHHLFTRNDGNPLTWVTVGVGDGGNEIGMGKIPHGTIVKNIPNGDLIHCRVPTDHLIVAGVSNWGAYALAAGVYVLRGVKPPADLFDPDREREILEVMVREGPLVDGVTGKQTATVDGLTWDEYVKPLVRIREILEA